MKKFEIFWNNEFLTERNRRKIKILIVDDFL